MPVLTNPYFTQKVDMNSRFLGPTTALSFHAWETHLQDTFHSLLVLIHINGVNFLFWFGFFSYTDILLAGVVEVCLQVLQTPSLPRYPWVLIGYQKTLFAILVHTVYEVTRTVNFIKT